jgi:hypothetical protein
MPRLHTSRPPQRGSGGERVFSDGDGRLWSASFSRRSGQAGAIVFACISDSRHSVRAIEAEPDLIFADVGDDMLRTWLQDAPRIGRLT